MKTNIIKIAFVAMCLMGIQSFTNVSQLHAGDIVLIPITPIDPNPQPHRGPQQSIIPHVEINDACNILTFTGCATISAIVEIENQYGNIVATQVLFLTENGQVQMGISTLPEGDYTLRLTINDQIYEGEFTK